MIATATDIKLLKCLLFLRDACSHEALISTARPQLDWLLSELKSGESASA
jgi:hypothetical protein